VCTVGGQGWETLAYRDESVWLNLGPHSLRFADPLENQPL